MRRKNLGRIPDIILVKLNGTSGDIIVATAIRISKVQIERNEYEHLGIKITDGKLSFVNEVMPLGQKGKYSKRNIEGKTIILRDLPKVPKTLDLGERHPFGNVNRPTFTLYVNRMVYQRKVEEPKNKTILVELLSEEEGVFTFKISVNEVLRKSDNYFANDLLFNLNILYENVGNIDVYDSDSTREDYLASLNVTWELLPPGTRDKNLELILREVKVLTPSIRNEIEDKYDFLSSLKPIKVVKGSSGMIRYFGMMYKEDLVVFETLNYGYAVYVMYDNWNELSTASRTQLLNKEMRDFDRVVHKGKWKDKIVELIASKLASQN